MYVDRERLRGGYRDQDRDRRDHRGGRDSFRGGRGGGRDRGSGRDRDRDRDSNIMGSGAKISPGDWRCGDCGNINFKNRA